MFICFLFRRQKSRTDGIAFDIEIRVVTKRGKQACTLTKSLKNGITGGGFRGGGAESAPPRPFFGWQTDAVTRGHIN